MPRSEQRGRAICRGGPLNGQGWWADELEARNEAARAVATPFDPGPPVLYHATPRTEQVEVRYRNGGNVYYPMTVYLPDHVPERDPDPEPTPEVAADLAQVDELHVYVDSFARPTSVKAAAAAWPRSGTQRRRVLDAILDATRRGHGGATDPELQRHLDMSPNTERPRRLELVEQGFVADSGATRQHHGHDHIVWCATLLALNASVPSNRGE
jgi:hypothetical protein